MPHRVELEIGRKVEGYGYYRGLYTYLVINDGLTIGELLEQAEEHAKYICSWRQEKFVEVMIRSIQKDYSGEPDTSRGIAM